MQWNSYVYIAVLLRWLYEMKLYITIVKNDTAIPWTQNTCHVTHYCVPAGWNWHSMSVGIQYIDIVWYQFYLGMHDHQGSSGSIIIINFWREWVTRIVNYDKEPFFFYAEMCKNIPLMIRLYYVNYHIQAPVPPTFFTLSYTHIWDN